VPVSRRNIGRRGVSFLYHFSDIVRFGHWTENPRVGGSIPPLATNKSIFQIKKLRPRALALFSNISAGVQYFGPLFALTNTALMAQLVPSCYGPEAMGWTPPPSNGIDVPKWKC
jgi:hypothetical protein